MEVTDSSLGSAVWTTPRLRRGLHADAWQALERSAQLSAAFQRAAYLEVLLLHSGSQSERQVAHWVSQIRAGKRDLNVVRSATLEASLGPGVGCTVGAVIADASPGTPGLGLPECAVDAVALTKPYIDILQRSLEVAVEIVVACIETLTAVTTTFHNGAWLPNEGALSHVSTVASLASSTAHCGTSGTCTHDPCAARTMRLSQGALIWLRPWICNGLPVCALR